MCRPRFDICLYNNLSPRQQQQGHYLFSRKPIVFILSSYLHEPARKMQQGGYLLQIRFYCIYFFLYKNTQTLYFVIGNIKITSDCKAYYNLLNCLVNVIIWTYFF